MPLRRVIVVGTTGSGKSTLAEQLARRFGAEHIELDAYHHGAGWIPVPRDRFQEHLQNLAERPQWVIDGNYLDLAGPLLWPRAELIVWLDMPLVTVVLPRLIKRSVTRIVRGTELWHGNRETWSTLLGKNSLLRWAVVSHLRHRRELPVRLAPPHLSGPLVLRFRSPTEVGNWLRSLDRTMANTE